MGRLRLSAHFIYMRDPWGVMTRKGFVCKRCGECCHSPRLYDDDVRRLNKAGLKDAHYSDPFGMRYIKDANGWCLFKSKRGNKAICGIYDIRPRICRIYPSGRIKDGSCRPMVLSSDKLFEKAMAQQG